MTQPRSAARGGKPSILQVPFAKYDLRDGFFHVPVHPSSRNRMLIRHPISGLLMRCCRLPFGYVAPPLCFCAVSEEVAQRFRTRIGQAGLTGVHHLAYVDDFLLVADSEDLARHRGAASSRGSSRRAWSVSGPRISGVAPLR